MSFAVVVNILTMLLCAAVTVQSLRMMRKLDAVKQGDLGQVVAALDQAAVQARIVLCELKGTLAQCGDRKGDLTRAAAIADELALLVELADARAERLAATASALAAPPARSRAAGPARAGSPGKLPPADKPERSRAATPAGGTAPAPKASRTKRKPAAKPAAASAPKLPAKPSPARPAATKAPASRPSGRKLKAAA